MLLTINILPYYIFTSFVLFEPLISAACKQLGYVSKWEVRQRKKKNPRENEKPQKKGRSGGPLLDRNGYLIGIARGKQETENETLLDGGASPSIKTPAGNTASLYAENNSHPLASA